MSGPASLSSCATSGDHGAGVGGCRPRDLRKQVSSSAAFRGLQEMYFPKRDAVGILMATLGMREFRLRAVAVTGGAGTCTRTSPLTNMKPCVQAELAGPPNRTMVPHMSQKLSSSVRGQGIDRVHCHIGTHRDSRWFRLISMCLCSLRRLGVCLTGGPARAWDLHSLKRILCLSAFDCSSQTGGKGVIDF